MAGCASLSRPTVLGTSHSCSKGTPKTMKIYGPFVTFEEATMAKGRYSVTPGAREPV
jgi:hypothetical protein